MMNTIKYSYPKNRSLKLLVSVFVFIGLNTFCLSAYSQNDTTTAQTDSIVKYLTPLEYAFMMHEETSWLVKVNYTPNTTHDIHSLGISVEKRIAPAFTINLKLEANAIIYQSGSISDNTQIYSLEARWYYRMKKRIRENKGALNMSGNYLSLSIENYFSSGVHFFASIPYVKWGIQRRFLKNGYIDFGLKAGVGGIIKNNWRTSLQLGTFTDIGLAFTKDKYKLDHKKLCPVLKCYDADNFAIKTDLVSLLHIYLSNNLSIFVISPNIALERKIGKSAFSINTELNLLFRYFDQTIVQQDYKYLEFEMSLMLESRWYYNLKNRMLKGKTGNSLSANYIALGGSYTISQTNNYDSPLTNLSYPSIHLSTGIQRLISEHLYYDFNIGVGYIFDKTNRPDGLIVPFNIAVGYRF